MKHITLRKDLTASALRSEDYGQLPSIWSTSNIDWSDVSTEDKLARFLARNLDIDGSGLSSVVRCGEKIVGILLCGEDGLYAYIYHMAVVPEFRRCGIGTMLANRSLAMLKKRGIDECRLFVRHVNLGGGAFWASLGFKMRETVYSMSISTRGTENE